MTRLISSLAIAALAAACGPSGPLGGLDAPDRAFLFADAETDGVFMGHPEDPSARRCDPRVMSQAYVFVDGGPRLELRSVRPSGVERHKIKRVERVGDSLVVYAENGARAPFSLTLRRTGPDQAEIGWDDLPQGVFERCDALKAG